MRHYRGAVFCTGARFLCCSVVASHIPPSLRHMTASYLCPIAVSEATGVQLTTLSCALSATPFLRSSLTGRRAQMELSDVSQIVILTREPVLSITVRIALSNRQETEGTRSLRPMSDIQPASNRFPAIGNKIQEKSAE